MIPRIKQVQIKKDQVAIAVVYMTNSHTNDYSSWKIFNEIST